MNDNKKPKKEIKFQCSIMKESELREKLKKKFEIKDDAKRKRLRIQYTDKGKTKSFDRQYNLCGKDAAMIIMESKKKELINFYIGSD